MKPMAASSPSPFHELAWTEPDERRHAYVLCVDGEEAGWLRFDDESGDRATGELHGERWQFERTGFPHTCVTIRAAGSRDVCATFTERWSGGGTVSFTGGSRYCWNASHIWSTTWCFRREGSGSAVCVSQQADPLKSGGRVRVHCGAEPNPEFPVLVLLGWYLRVLSRERLAETFIA
jgi:hypothetical protein